MKAGITYYERIVGEGVVLMVIELNNLIVKLKVKGFEIPDLE